MCCNNPHREEERNRAQGVLEGSDILGIYTQVQLYGIDGHHRGGVRGAKEARYAQDAVEVGVHAISKAGGSKAGGNGV